MARFPGKFHGAQCRWKLIFCMCMCLLSLCVDSGLHMILNTGEEKALGISLQEHSGRTALSFMEVQSLHEPTKKSHGAEKQHSPIHPLSAKRHYCPLHAAWDAHLLYQSYFFNFPFRRGTRMWLE